MLQSFSLLLGQRYTYIPYIDLIISKSKLSKRKTVYLFYYNNVYHINVTMRM